MDGIAVTTPLRPTPLQKFTSFRMQLCIINKLEGYNLNGKQLAIFKQQK